MTIEHKKIILRDMVFALSRKLSPTRVSKYTIKLIDKSLLQKKLKEYTEIAEEEVEANEKR